MRAATKRLVGATALAGIALAASPGMAQISGVQLAQNGGGAGSGGAAGAIDLERLARVLDEQARQLEEQRRLIERQEALIAEQQRELRSQRDMLMSQWSRIDDLSTQVGAGIPAPPSAPVTVGGLVAQAPPVQRSDAAVAQAPSADGGGAAPTPPAGASGTAPGQAPEQDLVPRPELASPERGGVLLRQGTAVVEPSVEFSLSQVNRVEVAGFTVLPAILIGSFEVSEAERKSVTSAVTVRYGLTDRLEIEGRVPFVYRDDRQTARPIGESSTAAETTTVDGAGLGDLEVAAHYQINEGGGGWPFLVGNLRVKSTTGTDPFEVSRNDNGVETELPTGTGFWGIQPSLTAIWPSDPAVFYANLGYTWNIERDVGGEFGTIDPGDVYQVNAGVGLALNERASLSLGYDHQVITETIQNGETVEDGLIHVGRLLLGSSYRFSDRISLNFQLGVGVTEDAPDMTATVRVPITFDVF